MKGKSAKPVHCAIYTRVSTDQGLEQDFNSLDAQYDASQAYIRSQAHAGWTQFRAKYEDGGFSGGNTVNWRTTLTPGETAVTRCSQKRACHGWTPIEHARNKQFRFSFNDLVLNRGGVPSWTPIHTH